MGPSYFWGGLTPPDPPLFRTLTIMYKTLQGHCTVKLQNNTKRRQAVAGLVTKGRPEQYSLQVAAEVLMHF